MPTYEYQCENCGYEFEEFQNMTDARIKECPKCAKQVKRLIGSGMGVIIKHNNFYLSDDRKNNLAAGGTCCGREKRCDKPPCSDDGVCKK